MIEVAVIIAFFVIIYSMASLGAVLLTAFVRPRWPRSSRVFVSSVMGPTLVTLPILVFALDEQGEQLIFQSVALGLVVVLTIVLIGWPTAYFATKRLDRMTQFDPDTFS